VAIAKDRLDDLNVEVASIEGNIARLDAAMENVGDDEYATMSRQHVHALTAKRYCTVEQAWLRAWLRKNDPEEPTRLLRGILLQLTKISSLLSQR
jgi:hypothetical protein